VHFSLPHPEFGSCTRSIDSVIILTIYIIFCEVSKIVTLQILKISTIFELCRRTHQPNLTFHLVGGSTFGLWPLFHLRDGGKWTEMTATQHGGTLRHLFLHYETAPVRGRSHRVSVVYLCNNTSGREQGG
jgi:hypothetical protein